MFCFVFFFFKQKTAYEMRISDWSSDVCSSDLVGDRIILSYLGDAKSEARMVALDGKPIANINLADIGSASGFGGKSSDPETFYAFSSYARPTTTYRFDTQTGKSDIFAEPTHTFKPAAFNVEPRFHTSKDGPKVPILLVND